MRVPFPQSGEKTLTGNTWERGFFKGKRLNRNIRSQGFSYP